MTEITTIERHHTAERRIAVSDVVALRQGLATEIKGLMQEWTANTLGIGKKLVEARATFPTENGSRFAPRPGWRNWVKQEFGFSHQWAANLINAYVRFRASTEVAALPCKVMLLLAAPSVPQEAVDQVLAEAERGNVTEKRAKQIAKAAKAMRARTAHQNHAARTERLAEISANSAELPTGQRFPVLYADPAWHFEPYDSVTGTQRSPAYPTMTADEICALQVAQLATDDAILFLWTTSAHLEDGFQVIKAWGFEYAANIVWVKDKTGLGYWVRSQHEHLLIAKRGNFPAPLDANRPRSVITAPRREHSRKPDEAYALIERLYPDLPKLELFARHARAGWSRWGNEAPTEDAA
jgi:N6-adenosine-specific RNA methylase IME4